LTPSTASSQADTVTQQSIGAEEKKEAAKAAVAEQTEWPDPPKWLPKALHSLAYRNFFLLWVGQLTRALALYMDMVARPTLILTLTGSPVQLGLISLVRGVPMLLLAPIAGLMADRFDRRLLMLLPKVLISLINILFAVLVCTGEVQVIHIYITAALKSLIQVFDTPARQALLPSLVPPRLLVNALAINSGTMQVVRIFSASLAGFSIAIWAAAFGFSLEDSRSFGGVYIMLAVIYVICTLSTYYLQVPEQGRVRPTRTSWIASLVEGFRFAGRTPVILGILVLLGVQSLFGAPYTTVFVPWLSLEVMEIGPAGMGLLIGVSGIGSLLGAMFLATRGEKLYRRGLLVVGGLFCYGLALAGLGLSSLLPVATVFGLLVPIVPMFMIMCVGLFQSSITTIKNSVLLEYTPNELRGRIYSIQSLDRSMNMLGSSTAGFVIMAIGGPAGLGLFGFMCAASAVVVGLALPALRKVN